MKLQNARTLLITGICAGKDPSDLATELDIYLVPDIREQLFISCFEAMEM